MRFALELIGLVLILAARAWMSGSRRVVAPPVAGGNARSSADEPLLDRPVAPRGFAAVAVTGSLVAIIAAVGLIWHAVQQHAEARATAVALARGDPDRASALITRYGCGGCHTVPGAAGADGKVGPELAGLRERVYIGDGVRNTPDDLVRWIVDPQRVSPRSAMPATGISEAEARDVATYLYMH